MWLFEGRGILKVGAHTAGHNRDGVGWGVFGNFDRADTDAARAAVDAIEWRVAQLDALPNLGSVKNPRGWNAWGHRDTSTKTCPGHSLYPLLADFQLGDDMTLKEGNTGNDVRFFQKALNNWPGTDPDLTISGVYDAAMTAAVRKYQQAANVDATGEIDWLTGILLAEYNPDKVAPSGGVSPAQAKAIAKAVVNDADIVAS